MGKPTICIGENKGADQLRGNRKADQRLCFRYSDSTIPPLLNSQNFKHLACFCACSARFVSVLFGNHIVGFTTRWLIYSTVSHYLCSDKPKDHPHRGPLPLQGSHITTLKKSKFKWKSKSSVKDWILHRPNIMKTSLCNELYFFQL